MHCGEPMKKILTFVLCLLVSIGSVTAKEKKAAPTKLYPEEKVVTTEHTAKIGDKSIRYRATTGNSFVFNNKHEKIGSIFYTAYTQKGVKAKDRPITFAYNGGPGSSSVWLHIGILGPKRVPMDKEGFPLPPPYQVIDNPDSILDQTDLVFIDPVGTGYSRAHDKGENKDFHGVWEDVRTVSEFIRLYLTRNKRWASPKYLIGESYGTTRSAGIAYHMGQRQGVYFNGVMLISSVLNFQLDDFGNNMNILPPTTMLPSYTAASWYHKKLSGGLQANLEKAIEEAKTFALNDYALALLQGTNLSSAKRDKIAARLAELTGLDKKFILENNLRISLNDYLHNVLRDEGKTIGRLDGRFVTPELDAMTKGYRDPSYMAIHGPYTGALMDYFSSDLNYQSDLPYYILGGGVGKWNFDEFRKDNMDISGKLGHAMLRNPDMKIFVASGYYDFATPFFATDFTFSQMDIPKKIKDNVTTAYYESGHMMYIREEDLTQLSLDLRDFIKDSH